MCILLGVDGSDYSMAGAYLLRNLALPRDGKIDVVTVLDAHELPHRAALDEARLVLEQHGQVVQVQEVHGRPVEELTACAANIGCDLMVIGAQGLHATPGARLGRVAQQLVEQARWPVLIVRTSHAQPARVLLATDGSPECQSAAGFLAGFPLPAGVEAHVIHVLPSKTLRDFIAHEEQGASGEPEAPSPSTVEQRGQAIVAEAARVLQAAGLQVTQVLARGDTATEIIEYVNAHNIDLLVTGARGPNVVTGWLLGSVSRRLVHTVQSSIVVVKGLAPPMAEESASSGQGQARAEGAHLFQWQLGLGLAPGQMRRANFRQGLGW